MSFVKWFNNLTGGEWTPLLDGRSDLEKYDTACRTLENVRPLPYGGGRIRSGLEFIIPCKYPNDVARLIPFNFSTGTRFVIEAGNNYMRFCSNGVQVQTSPGVAYEISTPYASNTVFVLQFKQINDIMYIVHPVLPPYKLSRISDTNWTLAAVDWTYPPLREENTSAITMTVSATTGTGKTLTASAPYFAAAMVGAFFEVRHLREGDALEHPISATGGGATTSSSLKVKGDWNLVTTERWYGTLEVQRSTDAGSTWATVRKFKSSAERNVSASGTELEQCLLRLRYTPTGDPYGASVWVGTAPTNYVKAQAKLEIAEAYASGLVKVTGYTDTTHLTVDIIQEVAATTATDVWSEGAWSSYRGYPAAVGLFEQRLLFGSTSERPNRFWGSVTGDFENFTFGEDDDAAIAFDIASTESNPIKWIESLKRIQIGTSGDEYTASSGNEDEPLTPSNVSVRGQSAYGSGDFQPVRVNDAIIFIQRQGKKLREMSYDLQRDGYVSPDLTLLAEHITGNGVIQLGFARQPDPLVVASTGQHLAVLSYDREQNVTAWARYTTEAGGGFFESVCAIYGNPADEVWCVVRRIINGSQVRYIERFAAETDDKTTCRLLDSWKSGTLTGPFSGTISGLSHLNGKTARLVVAGANIGDFVVSGGSITVPPASVPTLGTYVVGLPYRAIIQPMRMEVAMANGPSAGRTRRVSSLTLRFKDTLGPKFGPDLNTLEEVVFRNADESMDNSPALKTGDFPVAWNGGYDKSGTVVIVQDQPFPFTLIGIAAKAEVTAA